MTDHLAHQLRDLAHWCHCHHGHEDEPLDRPFYRHHSCATILRAANQLEHLQTRLINLTAELANLNAQLKDHT